MRALPGTGLAGPRLTELHVCYFSPEDFPQNQICSRFKGASAQRSQLAGSCRLLLCLQITAPLEHLAATQSDWRETLPVLPTSADRKKAYLTLKPLQQAQTPATRGACRQAALSASGWTVHTDPSGRRPRMLREPRMSHTSMQLFLKQLVCCLLQPFCKPPEHQPWFNSGILLGSSLALTPAGTACAA